MHEPLQRTVTASVYEHLRGQIRGGVLAPGQRIDQAGVARHFGASIVPVREALARLQAEGLVQIVPHRGAFVAEISQDALVDIYAMRELLEEQAGRLAATHLSDDDLARLDQLVALMETATLAEDYQALFEHNRAFHFTIYRAARRAHLIQIIEQLWNQGDHYRRVYTELPDRARMALAEHRAILEACRRRDPDALGLTVRHHVHQTTASLLEHMRAAERAAEIRHEHRAA
jgi:DNA-binding GntR family transcriptional regulator